VANTRIQLKFSTVASNTPTGLANGEIAINSADGKLYYRTPSGSITYLNATYPAGLTTEVQFNDAGSLGSNAAFTFNKTTSVLTVTGNVSTTNLISSGYIQFADGTKQYTANAGSGSGSGTANTSGWLANSVIFANATGYLSNTNNLQFFTSNNVLQVTTLTTVGTSGNITNVNYISANGITTTGSSGNISGVNFVYANNYVANTGGYFQFADGSKQYTANADSGAYAFANTVNIKVDSVYAFANIANIKVDSVYAFANIANIKVDSAYAFANTVNIKTDAAFTRANTANTTADAAFSKANGANTIAQAGFDFANTVNIKVDSAYAFANIANIKVDSAYAFANTVNIKTDSAYAWANTINIKVDSAYTQANSANILAQAAFNAANSAGGALSQAAFDKANSANVLAQAAFDKANTGGTGSSGNTSIGENIFTANGSQTAFTLSTSVTQDSVLVFVSGVLQPNSYYTVVGSNTTITLADAPAANDTVVVKKFAGGGSSSGGGASVSISDAPPTSPTANSLWWQSNTGILKIYYTDADSS